MTRHINTTEQRRACESYQGPRSRPKQGLVSDIKISKDPSLETLQRSHKLAPGKVKIVAKLRPCAKYIILSPPSPDLFDNKF